MRRIRSIALIAATAMALAALFVAYWHWSAASTPPQPVASQPASRPVRDVESGGGLGVWVPMYDKTGRLRQQFRAQRFDPRGGGLYHVIRPEAEFYFTQGSTPPAGTRPSSQPSSPQVVRLVGVEGDVNTVAGRTDPTLGSPMPSSLSRGVLQDVTISIYPDTTAASRDQADMTFTMDNLAFDNDTFRIYTPGGPNTAPDRVPVRGYGNDADFDGEGLEMRWDEMAHRLLSLEIAHGHRLTVKNAAALGMENAAQGSRGKGSGGVGANTGAAASVANGAPAATGPVTADGSNGLTTGGSTTLTAGGSTTAPSQAQLYRANFHDNVRVVQGGVEKITADVMHVDFVSGSSVPPATKPAPGPGASTQIAVAAAQSTAGGAAISGDVAGAGGGALAHDAGGSTGFTTGGSTALTTGSSTGVTPGTGPVDVYWTGILRIVPLDAESSGPAPTAGKAIVRLDGNPVHGHDGTAQVTGAHVTYWGSDQSALAEGSTAVPAELTDSSPDGSLVLDAAWMRFDGTGQAATLGPGRGKFRGKPSAPGAAEPVVDVNWTRQVTVNLTPGADGSLTLRRARLEGNVDVHSSTGVYVSGDSMDMTFDPSLATPRGVAGPNGGGLTGSTLTRAVVEKGAMCELTDANGIKRTIAGDEVSMEMGRQDGNAYPKHVNADGSVVVTTPDGRLQGAHLESTLLPAAGGSTPLATGGAAASASPAGAVRLQEMEMTRDVKLTGQNGVAARGTELNVRTTDAGENIVLWGEPAWATDGASTLTGPSIVLLPAAQQASVSGAGTLVTTRNAGAGLMPGSTALTTGGSAGPATRGSTAATTRQSATQPVTITWKNGATLDGQQNELDVTGTVNLHTMGDDGADQDASAAKMVLTLADKPPTTAPTRNPAANKGPSTRNAPASTALTATDPLDVGNMGFMSNKQVTAAKLIGGAKVASVLNGPDGNPVRTQSLMADEIDLNAIQQIMTVPGPGELIATETGPTTRPATAAAAGAGGSSGNGSTGISWNKRLVYDTAKGVATFDGPAHVVHLDGSTPAVRTDMYADQLVATFGTGATAAGGAQQLKSLTASGQVRMQTRGQVIDGGTLLYDPIAQYVIIRGTDQWPGSIHDAQGLKNNAFNVLEMDLQTGQIKILEGMSGQIQR